MRKALITCISLLVVTGLCLGEDPALTFHNNTQRTGRTTYLGPLPPRLRWTIRTEASIEASPVIGRNGTIYLASTDGRLYALSARGGVKWIFEAKESIFRTWLDGITQ
jgi:outer membrane protein assembly factor BamB